MFFDLSPIDKSGIRRKRATKKIIMHRQLNPFDLTDSMEERDTTHPLTPRDNRLSV
ncbi:MAG: hypothetical protein NVS4B1_22870 [Ktedonobacteraceae bacterium]